MRPTEEGMGEPQRRIRQMSNGEESGKSVFEKLHEASQLASGVDLTELDVHLLHGQPPVSMTVTQCGPASCSLSPRAVGSDHPNGGRGGCVKRIGDPESCRWRGRLDHDVALRSRKSTRRAFDGRKHGARIYGDRAAAPTSDWSVKRLGSMIPDANETIRGAVGLSIASALGVPISLLTDADGVSQRESWRRFIWGSVAPLARVIGHELLSSKLDLPTDLKFDFSAIVRLRYYGSSSRYTSSRRSGDVHLGSRQYHGAGRGR